MRSLWRTMRRAMAQGKKSFTYWSNPTFRSPWARVMETYYYPKPNKDNYEKYKLLWPKFKITK